MEPRQTRPTDGPAGPSPFEAPPGGPDPGWGTPPPRGRGFDVAALFVLLDGLRRVVPRDLDQQLTNLIRELLLTLRATIDWYLERLDRQGRGPEVEDIPIE